MPVKLSEVVDLSDYYNRSAEWQVLIQYLTGNSSHPRSLFDRIYWHVINAYPNWIVIPKLKEWLDKT